MVNNFAFLITKTANLSSDISNIHNFVDINTKYCEKPIHSENDYVFTYLLNLYIV